TANGPLLLTVPVHANLGQAIETVAVRESEPWRLKHARSIEQAYRKAPYFVRYWDMLRAAYDRPWTLLNELNKFMLADFLKALGIETRVVYASQLDAPGSATERLIHLIKTVGGTRYYSGAYATDAYLDANALRDSGISLEIQHWESPVYPQLHGAFEPDLSIVDLLMNRGGRSLRTLLGPNR
ncbi:MAG TPA: WbqC family protein, partial [Candidatus Hydrogenedentes bacterium]|nr:WbqC family protein [Candidatus Hydrogenedentota bacterium]